MIKSYLLHNEDGTIKNPGALDGDNWIVWGDLAQIDNENSSDKANLWKYWLDYILHYAELGIRGFRCDAAYQVPSSLWEYLIKEVNRICHKLRWKHFLLLRTILKLQEQR